MFTRLFGKRLLGEDTTGGDVLSRSNFFSAGTANTTGAGTAFVPPYAYVLEPASAVQAAVMAGRRPPLSVAR